MTTRRRGQASEGWQRQPRKLDKSFLEMRETGPCLTLLPRQRTRYCQQGMKEFT